MPHDNSTASAIPIPQTVSKCLPSAVQTSFFPLSMAPKMQKHLRASKKFFWREWRTEECFNQKSKRWYRRSDQVTLGKHQSDHMSTFKERTPDLPGSWPSSWKQKLILMTWRQEGQVMLNALHPEGRGVHTTDFRKMLHLFQCLALMGKSLILVSVNVWAITALRCLLWARYYAKCLHVSPFNPHKNLVKKITSITPSPSCCRKHRMSNIKSTGHMSGMRQRYRPSIVLLGMGVGGSSCLWKEWTGSFSFLDQMKVHLSK